MSVRETEKERCKCERPAFGINEHCQTVQAQFSHEDTYSDSRTKGCNTLNMRDDYSQINLKSKNVPVQSAVAGASELGKKKKFDFVKIQLTVFYRYPPRGSLIYQLPKQLLCYSQEPPVCLCCRYRSR